MFMVTMSKVAFRSCALLSRSSSMKFSIEQLCSTLHLEMWQKRSREWVRLECRGALREDGYTNAQPFAAANGCASEDQ